LEDSREAWIAQSANGPAVGPKCGDEAKVDPIAAETGGEI